MTDDEKIDPAEQLPDLRRATGYLLKLLREGVSTPDLADVCDWVDRSFADDPLARVILGTIEPDSLVLVWPAEKTDPHEAERLRDSLAQAMKGRFVGCVFPDPEMRVEHIDNDAITNLGLVRFTEKTGSAYNVLHRAAMNRIAKGPDDFNASVQLGDAEAAFGKALVAELTEE